MGEETEKIKQHIADERENLGRNLDEIEYRVKEATDLKAHFDKNTGWFLGAAVAGGVLLSLALRKSSEPARHNGQPGVTERNAIPTVHSTHFASTHLHRVSETIDDIFAGLVGVFSDRLQSFVADAVPGFREQYAGMKHRDHYGEQMRSPMER